MSALALRQLPGAPAAGQRPAARRLFAVPPRPDGTLDHAIGLVFTAIAAGAPAECPVCTGRLQPRPVADSGSAGASCLDCGSTLE